jgi:hypothetical protein
MHKYCRLWQQQLKKLAQLLECGHQNQFLLFYGTGTGNGD